MKRWLLVVLLPIALLSVAVGVLAVRHSGDAEAEAVPGDSATRGTAQTDLDRTALIASLDAKPLSEMANAGLAAKCYLVRIDVLRGGCGCPGNDLYILRYLCYSPSKGWYYVNYWYCEGAPCPCLDQFVTDTCSEIDPSDPWCKALSHHEDPNFDVQFDAYGRVVYCDNVQDSVKINWVELTMNVQSVTEPLDCQGAQTVRPALEGGWQTYRVNTQTPFPLDVGGGWRGSITFWDNRTFKKSNGDARFWVKDLAGVRAMMADGNSTCGDSPYVGTPGLCFDEFFGGFRILTEKLATGGDWWFQRRDPPGLCGL